MKYGILISLFLMITNCVAMDAEVDWESKYKAYAQRRCEAFTGTEREMLEKLAEVAAQKKAQAAARKQAAPRTTMIPIHPE